MNFYLFKYSIKAYTKPDDTPAVAIPIKVTSIGCSFVKKES